MENTSLMLIMQKHAETLYAAWRVLYAQLFDAVNPIDMVPTTEMESEDIISDPTNVSPVVACDEQAEAESEEQAEAESEEQNYSAEKVDNIKKKIKDIVYNSISAAVEQANKLAKQATCVAEPATCVAEPVKENYESATEARERAPEKEESATDVVDLELDTILDKKISRFSHGLADGLRLQARLARDKATEEESITDTVKEIVQELVSDVEDGECKDDDDERKRPLKRKSGDNSNPASPLKRPKEFTCFQSSECPFNYYATVLVSNLSDYEINPWFEALFHYVLAVQRSVDYKKTITQLFGEPLKYDDNAKWELVKKIAKRALVELPHISSERAQIILGLGESAELVRDFGDAPSGFIRANPFLLDVVNKTLESVIITHPEEVPFASQSKSLKDVLRAISMSMISEVASTGGEEVSELDQQLISSKITLASDIMRMCENARIMFAGDMFTSYTGENDPSLAAFFESQQRWDMYACVNYSNPAMVATLRKQIVATCPPDRQAKIITETTDNGAVPLVEFTYRGKRIRFSLVKGDPVQFVKSFDVNARKIILDDDGFWVHKSFFSGGKLLFYENCENVFLKFLF